jgi:hypothetical protein
VKTTVQAFAAALVLTCIGAAGAIREKQVKLENESISGAARVEANRVWTWGDYLREWTLPQLDSRQLAKGPWGEGGCSVDLDGDGTREFVAVRAQPGHLGDLVWLVPGEARAETIDTESEVHDCLEASLFGRRGVLVIQRGIQVRFYERHQSGGWSRRDVYSIYTPSYQGGLALADVNRDGLIDIFCGNYWIRSPEHFELPWRLFAINTHSQEERSATFRVDAVSAEEIVVAQSHMDNAIVARYRRPSDPTQQWPEQRLGDGNPVVQPRGLLNWRNDAIVAERNGLASRLLRLGPNKAETLGTIVPAAALIRLNSNRVLVAGETAIQLWRID